MKRNVCFIPVRRGSKSIVNKNWKILYGKPLFCWILDTIIESGIGDEIWIATDAPEIKEIVNANYTNGVRIFDRSFQNAQDKSVTIDVILEFLTQYQPIDQHDYLITLQATSPFTTVGELLALDNMLKQDAFDSVVACCRLKKFRWSPEGIPLDYSIENKPRRQDYEGFLVETGSFFASKISGILKTRQMLSGKIGLFEVNPIANIDIDEEIDWKMAEAYLQLCKGIII